MSIPDGTVEGFINSHGTEATISAAVGCTGCVDSFPTGSVSGSIEFTRNGTPRRYTFNSDTASIVATLRTLSLRSLGAVLRDVTVEEIIGETTNTIEGCTLFLDATRLSSNSWIGSYVITFPDGRYLFIYGTMVGSISIRRQVFCESPVQLCNTWRVFGEPQQFILDDGAGNRHVVPTEGAFFFLEDGTKLIIASDGLGQITKARVILSLTQLSLDAILGYVATTTTVYLNQPDKSKIAEGTLDQYIFDALTAPQGTVDLVQGQTFKTPGGANITWVDNTITVQEPCATVDLEAGQKFLSPGGTIISWNDSTITVCEPGNCPSGNQIIWVVAGTPLQLTDGAGQKQMLEKNSNITGAIFTLQDGSSLIMSSTIHGGPITMTRYIFANTPLSPITLEGFDPTKTEVYTNGVNCTKIDTGSTLA